MWLSCGIRAGRRLKLALASVLIFASVATLAPAKASADHQPHQPGWGGSPHSSGGRPRPRWPSEVRVAYVQGGQLRAISGSGGRARLTVEMTDGYHRLWSTRVEFALVDGQAVRLSDVAERLELHDWSWLTLNFSIVERGGGTRRCRLATDRSWTPECDPGSGWPGEIHALERASRECAAFFGQSAARDRCVRLYVSPNAPALQHLRTCASHYDTDETRLGCVELLRSTGPDEGTELARGCSSHYDGDSNQLRCLQVAAPYRVNVDLLRGCSSHYDGDDNQLRCLQAAAPYAVSLDLLRGCSSHYDGDDNQLACLSATASRGDNARPLIEYCSRYESGDAAQLACLHRFR